MKRKLVKLLFYWRRHSIKWNISKYPISVQNIPRIFLKDSEYSEYPQNIPEMFQCPRRSETLLSGNFLLASAKTFFWCPKRPSSNGNGIGEGFKMLVWVGKVFVFDYSPNSLFMHAKWHSYERFTSEPFDESWSNLTWSFSRDFARRINFFQKIEIEWWLCSPRRSLLGRVDFLKVGEGVFIVFLWFAPYSYLTCFKWTADGKKYTFALLIRIEFISSLDSSDFTLPKKLLFSRLRKNQKLDYFQNLFWK